MKINLLKDGYKKSNEFYKAFLEDTLYKNNFISSEYIDIGKAPDLEIYFGKLSKSEKEKGFIKLINVLTENFLNLDKNIYMNEKFWHSYLCIYKRRYLLKRYPEIKEDVKKFRNIVIKDFNWENYLYKAILAGSYINNNVKNIYERERYYKLVVENLDVFNYIIKYDIFRNDKMLMNTLTIIDENNLSELLKARIKDVEGLGKDERYGRRVIYELNQSYPIILSPMLEKEDFEDLFFEKLKIYCPNYEFIKDRFTSEEIDDWE